MAALISAASTGCLGLFYISMVLSGASAQTVEVETQGKSFFDTFDVFDHGIWGISDGWSNGTWQNCQWSRRAAFVGDGVFHLTFAAHNGDYICGEIQSRERYGFGTFEARFRTTKGSGLNAAFFSYIGPFHDSPHDEIDFEVLTRDTDNVSLTSYVNGRAEDGAVVPLPVSADSAFLTYGFVRSSTGVRWYVEGREVFRTDAESPNSTIPQKIYASFWGSDTLEDWMGVFDPPNGTAEMQIDWIAFTEEGAPCQFAQSLHCTLDNQ